MPRKNEPRSRLLAFLPAFEAGEFADANTHYRATGGWTDSVAALYSAIRDSELFLTSTQFPWPSWKQEFLLYAREPERIRDVDLTTLRKLLALVWHQDRFAGGTLPEACSAGFVQAILERLRDLGGAPIEEPQPT